MKNILSVDVEEWFHPEALQHLFPEETWNEQPLRVEPLIERLLDVFARHQAKATFFVLGWVAEKYPNLIKKMVAQGHEVASHSYSHRMITKMSPREFKEDLHRSLDVLQNISGEKVLGFRAPTFSVTKKTFWAYPILIDAGLQYDSSVYPIWHDRYGVPEAPRSVYAVRLENGQSILEFPMPTLKAFGKNFPFGGGGYLRLFPLRFTMMAIRKFNKEGYPAIMYMHPWEFDTQQPKVKMGRVQSFRHYGRIAQNFSKLERLLSAYEWTNFAEYLSIVQKDARFPIKVLNL